MLNHVTTNIANPAAEDVHIIEDSSASCHRSSTDLMQLVLFSPVHVCTAHSTDPDYSMSFLYVFIEYGIWNYIGTLSSGDWMLSMIPEV